MPTVDDINDQIAADALTPASASNASGSVTKRSIDELIKARDAVAAQQSTTRPGLGLRFQKIRPVYE